ncbi:uncharacterized protein LOC124940408 isoform X2 [Impatiens glandulifera]|nr:uncharacterized protein LOC124940408 isoform X2 [Impatiens glandulifera]XP_047336880.1 uncharacterized protein LOC124940408 isoform X2 [Impatiens glandulifera]
MHEFSTSDGFVEINESVADMIKYVANEPSVGLFFVQQHAQNAIPNLVNLKESISGKSHMINLHTEDLEDSITMMRSMKDCGLPIANEMIGEIKKSLAIISSKQPKKGFVRSDLGRSSSWSPASAWRTAGYFPKEDERSGGYLSSVFKLAKERTTNSFGWSQLDSVDPKIITLPMASASTSKLPEEEMDELPLSSHNVKEELEKDEEGEAPVDENSSNSEAVMLSDSYDEFKADKEAKLKEWLNETDAAFP